MDKEKVKYLITEDMKEEVESNYSIDDLFVPVVIDRCVERIVRSVESGYSGNGGTDFQNKETQIHDDLEVELLSYILSNMVVSHMDDRLIINKFCRGEARSVIERAGDKVDEILEMNGIEVERRDMGSAIQDSYIGSVMENNKEYIQDSYAIDKNSSSQIYRELVRDNNVRLMDTYKIDYQDYISCVKDDKEYSTHKVGIVDGNVYLSEKGLKNFGISYYTEKLKNNISKDKVNEYIAEKIEDRNIINRVEGNVPESEMEFEFDEIDMDCFPPVMDSILERLQRGENLKHVTRVTLATFLLEIGMSVDEIVDLVGGENGLPDFAEKQTRYQLNHLQKDGGYNPPNYSKIESWGISWEKDPLEEALKNPIQYYQIKMREKKED